MRTRADKPGSQELRPVGFIYDPELAPGYSVRLRSEFLRNPEISPVAKVLYGLLVYYATVGIQQWPGLVRLARECAVTKEVAQQALSTLVAAGLVFHQAEGAEELYRVHDFPQVLPIKLSGRATSRKHIPQAQHSPSNRQMEQDAQLLTEKVGISKEAARELAQLAWDNRCSEGYVADIVEYATSTPGIKNPAGCVVELIKRNESRRPSQQIQQDRSPGLDVEKYTTGKYAFLFRPNGATETTEGEGEGRES